MTGLSKRGFLKAGLAGGLLAAGSGRSLAQMQSDDIDSLSDMTRDLAPISVEERRARVAKAQRLMRERGLGALVLEPGSSMIYFTGVGWWRSERFTGAVIPAEGDVAYVTPAFEEPSLRERITLGDDVRTWHEDENPFALVAGLLRDRKLEGKLVGFEASVRYFVADGIAEAMGRVGVSGQPVVDGCRMFKSPHELALMQRANDITLAAYKAVYRALEAGMIPADIRALFAKAHAKMGGDLKFALALIGESSAYPHGSDQPQILNEGQILLMDVGCAVHGYQSDISRTIVFGEPTARQRQIWNWEKEAQAIAFEAAQLGTACEEVDRAARTYWEERGFGPGYKTPGLPHRTGHGIGLDGHEPVNFVLGEKTPLQPGMCLSNEPGIYIYGEFGVRLEDCLYMTENGPRYFTEPSPSIDDPFGVA